MKASWLFSKNPLVVDKDLATVIGLNEAIVLQQINYWLHVPGGKNVGGRHWIKHTISEFLKKDFPFWSRNTVKRTISSCEKSGFLLKKNLNNAGFDKSNWYSIDEEKLNEVMSHASVQNEPTIDSKRANGTDQNEPTYTRDYTEIKTETNINRSSAKKQNDLSVSKLKETFEVIWKRYPNKKGKTEAFNHYKAWRKKSVKHTDAYLNKRLDKYLEYCRSNASWYHPMYGSTWFNGRFDDEISSKNKNELPTSGGYDTASTANIPDIPDDELPF